jgi:hypothetical protein
VDLKGALDERRKIEENLRRSETKRRPASKRNPPCKLNAEGVPNSTIFNGIDALSLLRDQALAGDPSAS